MSTSRRDELLHLIEGMTDDQVEQLLADARLLTDTATHRGARPPTVVGVSNAGPQEDSSPDYIDSAFGPPRLGSRIAARFEGLGLAESEEIPELRGQSGSSGP